MEKLEWWFSLGGFLAAIIAAYFSWRSDQRAVKKEKEDNYTNIEISWRAMITRDNPRNQTFTFPVTLHNTGKKMVNVLSITMNYMENDNEQTLLTFSLESLEQRVFNPGSSITFQLHRSFDPSQENFGHRMRETQAYLSVLDFSGQVFKSDPIGAIL